MKSVSLLLRLLLGLAFLCAGVYTYNQTQQDSSQKKHSKQWHSVDAVITDRQALATKANSHQKEKQPNRSQSKSYKLRISYRYTWNDRELFGALTIPTPNSTAEDALKEYPDLQKGAALALRVNPFDPTQSRPENLEQNSTLANYYTAGGMALIGLFLLIRTFIRIRK